MVLSIIKTWNISLPWYYFLPFWLVNFLVFIIDTFQDIVTTIVLKIGTQIPNKGFLPFPLSHLMSSQYSYHKRQLLDINGCCHSLSYLLEYGIMCIIHNNACNNSCYLWKYKIVYEAHTKIQLHSPCYRDLWLFSFLFQFLFYYLCSRHYSLSSKILFNSHNAYFILSTMCP